MTQYVASTMATLQISLLLMIQTFIEIQRVHSIPIPNSQIGKAEVECGEDAIEIVFLTESVFQGRIYVVGHSNDNRCVSRDTGRRTTSIKVQKDQCGVAITRSTNPPGMFANVKVMISFHEEFITKVDKGYEISCFYMEADKTVTYPLTVSMKSLEPFTELAEMPQCHYEVVDPISMEPLSVVPVGSKLLHKWKCDSTSANLWCMTVHSCFVEDGSGSQFVILNEDGCAIDRYLLDNLEYGPNELEAQKEAHAFKFADKVVVNFQCSVRLDIRDGECPKPHCRNLSGRKKAVRRRALPDMPLALNFTDRMAEVDVRSQQLDVLDTQLDFGVSSNNPRIAAQIRRLQRPEGDCISRTSAFFGTLLCAAVLLVSTIHVIYLHRRKQLKVSDIKLSETRS